MAGIKDDFNNQVPVSINQSQSTNCIFRYHVCHSSTCVAIT